MHPRKKIAAANWKMNKFITEGVQLAADILVQLEKDPPQNLLILCPPFIHLQELQRMLQDCHYIKLGAQNCHYEESGAFTGEISAPMLASLNVEYVIAGHSERRELFGESDEVVAKKVKAILNHGLKVIFCCGEPLEVREKNQQNEFVKDQLKKSLFHLSKDEMRLVVIAYEPIWAIGTGKNATPEQAQEMHQYIRELLKENFGEHTAEETSILYGGSVKAENAREIFVRPDVDGGLVGGASLKADDFVKIVRSL